MTTTRKRTVTISTWLKKRGIDYQAIGGVNLARAYEPGADYDFRELVLFTIILLGSLGAILLSYFFLQQ
jgi:hypothetical protein